MHAVRHGSTAAIFSSSVGRFLAMAFAQLRGRIGAARLALNDTPAGSEMRRMSSQLQANAVVTLLKSKSIELSDDDRAKLSTLVTKIPFLEADAVAILSAIASKTCKRREAQDMVAFLYYVSGPEWEAALQNLESALQVFVKVLVHRLGCVNATEPTLKRVASASLVCACSGDPSLISMAAKHAQLKEVKTQYRKVVRAVKEAQKKATASAPYIIELPTAPSELERKYPDWIASFKVDDCWVDPRVDMQKVIIVDTSFGCRGRDLPQQQDSTATLMAQCMLSFQQMMAGHRNRDRESDDLPITFAGADQKRKRCLKALLGGGEDAWTMKRRHRALSDWAEEHEDATEHRTHPGQAITSWQAPADAATSRTHDRPSTEAAPTPEATIAEETAPIAGASAGAELPGAMSRGAALLNALQEREQEKADQKKVERAEAKAVAAEAKAAAAEAKLAAEAKAAAAAKVAAGTALVDLHKVGGIPIKKPPVGVSSKQAAKNASKQAAEIAAKPKGKTKPGPQKYGISHEGSRDQYLARSAKNGSKGFQYGPGKKFAAPKAAKQAAMKWLQEQEAS